MKATETPMPTSVRPAAATSQLGASANAIEPSAATIEPRGSNRRGPTVSARIADRNLQHHVDIEIRRGERAQQRAVDRKGARQLVAIAAGAVRWKINERTKLKSAIAEDRAARRTNFEVANFVLRGSRPILLGLVLGTVSAFLP
jgi:hypothetical protein